MNRDTDPLVKCTRKRPPCGHARREHAPGMCFGIVWMNGVAHDCGCKKMMDPVDPPRVVRVGEYVED